MSQAQELQRNRIDQTKRKRARRAERIQLPESVGRDPNQRIAWVGETYEDDEGKIASRLLSAGMAPEAIIAAFPPAPGSTLPVNLRQLIRALIVEEYRLVGQKRPQGNVRRFRYTNILFTLGALGISVTRSVENTINLAWGDVTHPDAGLVTHEGMNIVSAKNKIRTQVPLHSPNLRFILAVEKEDYFASLQWIAELFGITLFAGGGQPSNTEAKALVRELKNAIDLDQDWVFLTITDLDPAGSYIEDTFVMHFEEALRGEGVQLYAPPKITRLFLWLDQVSDSLITNAAVPVKEKADITKLKPKAFKAFWTTIQRFEERLGCPFRHPNDPDLPIKIEMNAIALPLVERTIIKELLQLIEDETLMMIPELMALVNDQRVEIIKEIALEQIKEWLAEKKREWLQPIEDSKKKTRELYHTAYKIADRRREAKEELIQELVSELETHLEERFESWRSKKEDEAEELVNFEREIETALEEEIQYLQTKLEEIQGRIKEIQEPIVKTIAQKEDETEASKAELEQFKDLHFQPSYEDWDQATDKITEDRKRRLEELDKIQEELETQWGPADQKVKEQVQMQLSEVKVPIWFEDLEENLAIRKALTPLVTLPQLWEEGWPLIELPMPRFAVGSILTQAAEKGMSFVDLNDKNQLNLTTFRPAFTPSLLQATKKYVESYLRSQTLELQEVETPTWDEDILKEIEEEMEKERENLRSAPYEWN